MIARAFTQGPITFHCDACASETITTGERQVEQAWIDAKAAGWRSAWNDEPSIHVNLSRAQSPGFRHYGPACWAKRMADSRERAA